MLNLAQFGPECLLASHESLYEGVLGTGWLLWLLGMIETLEGSLAGASAVLINGERRRSAILLCLMNDVYRCGTI